MQLMQILCMDSNTYVACISKTNIFELLVRFSTDIIQLLFHISDVLQVPVNKDIIRHMYN